MIRRAGGAHGAGKILPKEMPIDPKTNHTALRAAPEYGVIAPSVTESVTHPYTVETLAKFLGFVKAKSETATNSFIAAFGAEELINDGVLKESQIKGLSAERLGELVISVRKQRDAAKAESERLAVEAKRLAAEPTPDDPTKNTARLYLSVCCCARIAAFRLPEPKSHIPRRLLGTWLLDLPIMLRFSYQSLR